MERLGTHVGLPNAENMHEKKGSSLSVPRKPLVENDPVSIFLRDMGNPSLQN